ncbi:MAG: peptidase C39 family protein [Synechococcaceae cyanobacterium SM2_3_1]|nr:peptidase C39 family protein [Synechococcaceae cyanobacterium SM2_3_1]
MQGQQTVAASNYQTSFQDWRGQTGDFQSWQGTGIMLSPAGEVLVDPQTAQREDDPYGPRGYRGKNFYNGSTYWVGEFLSPEITAPFPFVGALVSWNAETPAGTWMETLIRAQYQGRWTPWYNLGVWAADTSTIERHSVADQEDADAEVYTDLLVLKDEAGSRTYQVKIRLFSTSPAQSPRLQRVGVALSTIPEEPQTLLAGDPQQWGQRLDVSGCSQMVYPDGGEVWCSPTSVAMVLRYWQQRTGVCEPNVRTVVEGVYDWVYEGHGNWVFNTAYSGSQNFPSVVARFNALAQLEPWITAGVPVVISFAWKEGELEGVAIPKSAGHLAVLIGFDAQGNPIVNDPAAASDTEVERIYPRQQLEKLWIKYSGGTVYLIHPSNWTVPSLV